MQIETVKVVSPVSDENPHGYVVINKCDMTEQHQLYEEKAEPKKDKGAQKAEAEPKKDKGAE